MFPWFFYFAPQFHFPFSNFAQRIAPETSWFSDLITPQSGDAEIEEKAFKVASYGRQLGLIIEVLTDISEEFKPTSETGKESLDRLNQIRDDIEKLKADDAGKLLESLQDGIERLRRCDPERYSYLQKQLMKAESEKGG